MSSTSIPANVWLTREEAALVLRALGYPVASTSLATMATRGGGPMYRRFGLRCLYRRSDLERWARAKLSKPRRSASEGDAADPVARGGTEPSSAEARTPHHKPRRQPAPQPNAA